MFLFTGSTSPFIKIPKLIQCVNENALLVVKNNWCVYNRVISPTLTSITAEILYFN